MQVHYVSVAMKDVHGRAGITPSTVSRASFMPVDRKVGVMLVYMTPALIAHQLFTPTTFLLIKT